MVPPEERPLERGGVVPVVIVVDTSSVCVLSFE